ncbi:IPTL-CTERM sorting domain-containing protein [Comamonas sp. JUb58]|uniref:IPTL-CTERM sorting domain-containing protein n=1 Tax=Comamonas sp. JUb58 TaxID=2485114 RepID=UPI0010CE3A0F|nr:IPTL-CTERM sorting domain-containing protein [Comamonas sp. JUb58]TDS83674.1 putative secreted protein (IPTL-CTERM system target) [Comamonas sp. JUb58]
MPTLIRAVFRNYAAVGLLICTSAWAPLSSAQIPPPPFVAVNSLPIDEATSYQFESPNQRGPTFQTGTIPTRIQEIAFGFDLGDSVTATLSLYQLDNTTNLPTGSALASTPISMVGTSAATDVITYNATQLGAIATTTLQSGQKYALILSNASAFAGVTNDDNTQNGYTFAGGFSVAGDGHAESTDNGATWHTQGGTPAFRMTVVPFEDVVVPPITAPTPVPGLGATGLVSLVSIMGFMGLRRARKSA